MHMPAPYHSNFLQAGCSSGRQTNSVKALKVVLPVITLSNMTLLLPLHSKGLTETD